jgi:4-diphosphocytidyl-2-C-methyl-D-erythritol kinase
MTHPPETLRWEGRAPAKVNLFLRVLAREESGFHQIETLFQALELSDTIRVELVDRPGIHLDVDGAEEGSLGPMEKNLAVKGARAWLEAYREVGGTALAGGAGGIQIHLEKKIPHGGGLGGGSSDAAAVLRGLEELHQHPLGRERLIPLAAGLGADVAFFALDVSRALAWGRGDRLLPLSTLPVRSVLLARPPFRISTPWAYEELARHRSRERLTHAGGKVVDPVELESWPGMVGLGENAFEGALDPRYPQLALIRSTLLGAGAEVALLSGSGSTVFGLFPDEELLAQAMTALTREHPDCMLTSTRTAG